MATYDLTPRAHRHPSGHASPSRGRRDRRLRRVRDALQAAVTTAHLTRPATGAPAAEQAVYWHHTASAFDLIADNEVDPTRAESARADAEVARRLARGLGEPHVSRALATGATAELVVENEDEALDAVPELAADFAVYEDDFDVDELEVEWP